MVKCIKCENEIKYQDMPVDAENKDLPYGAMISNINIEIQHEFMAHAGSQTENYSGKLCDRCLLDLMEKDIINLPEGIR